MKAYYLSPKHLWEWGDSDYKRNFMNSNTYTFYLPGKGVTQELPEGTEVSDELSEVKFSELEEGLIKRGQFAFKGQKLRKYYLPEHYEEFKVDGIFYYKEDLWVSISYFSNAYSDTLQHTAPLPVLIGLGFVFE